MQNSFLERFNRIAQGSPTKIALVFQDEAITYEELAARAGRLAYALHAAGVKPGDIIPILLPRSIDAVVAMLGVQMSGAAFTNIAADYPQERIDYIVADTGANFILDEKWLAAHPGTDEVYSTKTEPNDPAIVVYTSGSTGNPKGVVNTYAGLSLATAGNVLERTAADVFLSVASFSFIAVALDLLTPLAIGATVHIAADEVRRDAGRLVDYIRTNRITSAFMPPQLAAQVLPRVEEVLTSLITGSEKVRGLYSSKVQIFNVYGLSESCGPLCAFKIDRPYPETTPIGVPYPGSAVYVLDDDNQPVAPGDTGEICISGQLAAGYLNLPELTAEKFTANHLTDEPGLDCLFHTGDLGKLDEAGNLVYVQRKDWMVKIRGYRVEPGEVEAAIIAVPGVSQAVVKGFANAAGETSLFAVYTADGEVATETVTATISRVLPNYMIPAFMEQVDLLPVNTNGKVDRKHILPPDAAKFKTTYLAPTNERERVICAAFERILGVEKIGVLDNFNFLGGDSISAARLQSELTNLNLSAGDILSLGTPQKLAALQKQDITKAAHRDEWPLTFAEKQMAIEQNLHPDSVEYNINLALEITGDLDQEKLQGALDALITRQPILRSVYPLVHGEYVHRILDELPLPIATEEIPADELIAAIARINRPFTLDEAPLLRVTLFTTAERCILHFNIHHIILDGSSADVFISELFQLYAGESLPPLELTYMDHAVWENENAEKSAGSAFFKEMFTGGVPETEMPTHPLRPEVLPIADRDIVRSLPVATVDQAAKNLGVSPFALMTTALAMTLAKYCGSEDVVVGTAMSGRNSPRQEDMIGMFVNTLPLRIKPVGDQAVGELALAVAGTVRGTKSHQTYPFADLVPQLAPDRNASRNPVYDVLFNYLKELAIPAIPGLNIRRLPLKGQSLAMDLVLETERHAVEYHAVLSYSDKLYDGAVVENFIAQFIAIIERLAKSSGSELVMDIAELPEDQQQQIVQDFRGESLSVPREETVASLFRRQARLTPNNEAVVSGETRLSYAELDEVTDRLASYLAAKSIGPGEVVGIMVGRSELMPLCALGVLKTGAAYLPMDPTYPSERLEYMLADAGAKLVIAEDEYRESIPGYTGEIMSTKEIASLPQGEVPDGPRPEDLFILLYTSGTTGKPKGVMLLQRNLVNFIAWYQEQFALTADDRVPAYASFGFDACMMDLYPALTCGACVHIISQELRLDMPGLQDYFTANGITVAFMTTQLGRQFAESMTVPSLRALSTGGETLVPLEPPQDFTLYNGYGPTECTIFSTLFPVDRLYDRVPIGKPLANTTLYVIDSRGRLAPVGVAGELCIAGLGVARGYLNRQDLTAEKFVPNPFLDEGDYATMYKTGDVVRYLPDGNIDFVGRRDFQVKIRGFRVELTEIEGRIRNYPGITDAAVIAADDAGGGKRVVAYIVAAETVDIADLADFIKAELPAYMVPSATMQIPAIPLNQNGKVNRRALPAIEIKAEEIVGPRSDLEAQLLEITAQVIGGEGLGVTTDLLYAGLNSLSAIKLATLITEETGKEISTVAIMGDKTIENIAARLAQGSDRREKAYDRQEAYPLTNNQLGLYFACIKDPGNTLYNIPFALDIPVGTDVERLKASLLAVIKAHPYIKTRFVLKDNQPYQLRLDERSVEVAHHQVTEEEFAERAASFVRPFNFFEGDLFRIEICETPTQLHLLCDFHHIIFDGGSLDIFLRDLTAAYGGEALTAEAFTSFDLALAEAEMKDSPAYNEAQAFFKERLGDGEGATQIPKDHEQAGGTLATVRAEVTRAQVADVIKGLGITPANLFLAATLLVTGRFASTNEVRIATITNGRDDAALQNNLGMLVKTLPVATIIDQNQTSGDFLGHAQELLLATLANQAYPFMNIASEFNFDPQILYAYQGGVVSDYQLAGEPLTFSTLLAGKAKFPFSVNVQADDKNFTVEIEYDTATFDAATAQTYGDSIAAVAAKLAQDTSRKIGALSVLTQAQEQALAGFNKEIIPNNHQALHHLFEAQVVANPEARALVAGDETLSYRELNERANRLANSLLALGVSREDRIAFLLPRDSRIPVAMLGIMKAGCAYIPVDPDYPEERIQHILTDSGAKMILTTGGREIDGSVSIDELLTGDAVENPQVPVRRDDLCYLIYTSGSTGKPKGVMVSHGNIINYVLDRPENVPVRALVENHCAMVSVTTVSFDMFLKEAFTTLMNGLTLILADDDEAKNPDQLAALFARRGGTAFNATPSRMLQYMELPAMQKALASCKVVMAGGEAYPPALYERLKSVTDAVLINTYGPTETTVSCNGKRLMDNQISVGAPLYNVVEQVVDIAGQPLPAGITGELYIGGTGVARGYFGNPEMTTERFVERDGIRYYKSGDLARWTMAGDIVIRGRNDGQIKLRGLRIELGEIENTLNNYPGIKGSVVLVQKLHGQEHLCAYYTAVQEINPHALREGLQASLTKYMVPTAYLQLDELPTTPNGKIDTKSLPPAKLLLSEEYVAPAEGAETIYCEIFKNILQMDKVGATDNFFDLGGTSLLVTQVTIDAATEGLELTYGDVFANPTPRELAALASGETAVTEPVDTDYDYTDVDNLLATNNLASLRSGAGKPLGNICLTGATGFLGIHVLKEYLAREKGTAYCVVRGGKIGAEKRLKGMLVYYFSDDFAADFGSRIVVIDGSITDPGLFTKLEALPIDTYLNCAANVKHFSAGTDIEDINVGGVENAIAFCQKKNCRLVQISTASVAGMSIDNVPSSDTLMDETMLYFGQDISNKYVHSKFLAERLILAAAAQGLDAKIMRAGNLMARASDGEFQANFNTNNFLGRLKAYAIVGYIPYSVMGMTTEFAPIDSTAEAVLKLAGTPDACRVFHPYNDHTIFMGDIIEILRAQGIHIEPCEQEVFDEAYKEAMYDKEKAKHLNSLIAYQERGKQVVPIGTVNGYTSQVLLRLGFKWPITTDTYLSNFIEMMAGLGYFDDDTI